MAHFKAKTQENFTLHLSQNVQKKSSDMKINSRSVSYNWNKIEEAFLLSKKKNEGKKSDRKLNFLTEEKWLS